MPAEKGIFLDVLPRFDMAALALILDKISAMFKKTGAAVGSSFGTEAEARIAALAEAERKASNIAEDAARRRVQSIQAVDIAQRESTLATERRIAAEARYQQIMVSTTATDNARAAATNRLTAARIAEQKAVYAASDAALIQTARNRDALRAEELAIGATAAKTKAVEGSTVAVSNMGKAFNVAGMAATGGFLFGMLESGKAAGNFEEKLTRLVASAGEVTGNIATVSQGLMNVAAQTGYSAQELADGMYLVEKAGYRGAEGITVMRAAAQLARAENTSLDEVTQGLTTTMRDFHIPVDQAALVASKLNVAVGDAKTNLQQFSGALHNIEPIASAAGMSIEEVYGAMARVSQSGTNPDMLTQQMANMVQHLMVIQAPQRKQMNMLGLDPDKLKTELSDPSVGFIGVLNQMQQAVQKTLTTDNRVFIDSTYKSIGAMRDMKTMYAQMSPEAKKLIDQYQAGDKSALDFRKERWKGDAEDFARLQQWAKLYHDMQGFSDNVKKGESQYQSLGETWKKLFGTDAGFKLSEQLVGANGSLDAYYNEIIRIKMATPDLEGNVKGFAETQTTLNAKMRDARAEFGNVAIQLGNVFLPVLKQVAGALGTVAQILAAHPAILKTVVGALGLFAETWLLVKAAMIGKAMWDTIVLGLTAVTGWFGRLTASIGLTITEMQGLAPAAATSATAVEGAAAAEVAAMDSVAASAGTARTAIAGVGTVALSVLGTLSQVIATSWAANTIANKVADTNYGVKETILQGAYAPWRIWAQATGTQAPDWADPYKQHREKSLNNPNPGGKNPDDMGTEERAAYEAQRAAEEKAAEVERLTTPLPEYGSKTNGPHGAMGDRQRRREQQQKALDDNGITNPYTLAPNGLPGALTSDVAPPLSESTLPDGSGSQLTDEANAKPAKKGKNGKDLPGGTKEDPVYTMALPQAGLNAGKGGGTTDNVGFSYDPFQEAGQGGWTLPNIARLMATYFTNLALGNPYGKLQAGKKGEDPNNPLYVQQVGVPGSDGNMISVTKSQLKMINAVAAEKSAEATYDKAVAKHGEGSPEAQKAMLNVMTKRQAIEKLQALAAIDGTDSLNPDDVMQGLDPTDPFAADSGGGVDDPLVAGRGRGLPMRHGGGGRMEQGAGGAERWRGAVRMALLKYGPSLGIGNGKAWEDAMVRQIATESMGDPGAQNPNDSNGRGGTQHVSGLLQFLPSTFASNNISGGSYMDPNAQIAAALKYVTSRYGMDASGAPLQIGRGVGYDTGGYLPPGSTTVQNDTGKPELVLNPDQQEALGLQPGGSGPESAPPVDPKTTQHGSGQGAAPGPPAQDGSRQITGGSGPGLGIKGGILGSALSAAGAAGGMALNAVAPGAGMATDIMTQEANRFVGYVGQLAGIAAGGLMETFMLNDSPLADPGKSLFGKVAMGIAGGHPSKPNTAGASAPPLKQQESAADQQVSPYGDLTITNNFHGTNDNADQVQREQNRGMLMYGGK